MKPADSRSLSALAPQQNVKPGHLPSRPGRQEVRKPVLRQSSLQERIKSQVGPQKEKLNQRPQSSASPQIFSRNPLRMPTSSGSTPRTPMTRPVLDSPGTRTPPRFLETPGTYQPAGDHEAQLVFPAVPAASSRTVSPPGVCGNMTPPVSGSLTPPFYVNLTPQVGTGVSTPVSSGPWCLGEATESSHIFEDPPDAGGPSNDQENAAPVGCMLAHKQDDRIGLGDAPRLDDGVGGLVLSPKRNQKFGDNLKSILRAEILQTGPLMEFDLNSPTYSRPRKSLEERLSLEGRPQLSLDVPSGSSLEGRTRRSFECKPHVVSEKDERSRSPIAICPETRPRPSTLSFCIFDDEDVSKADIEHISPACRVDVGRSRLSDHSSVSFELSPEGGRGPSTALSVRSLTSNGFSLSDSAPSSASATSVTAPSSVSRGGSTDGPGQNPALADDEDLECNCVRYPSARDARDFVDDSAAVTPVAVASVTDNATAAAEKHAAQINKVVDLCSLWESRCGDSAKRLSRSRGDPQISGESIDENAIVQDGRAAPRRKSGQFARFATETVRRKQKEGKESTDMLVRRLAERIKEVTGAEDIECDSSDSEAGTSPNRKGLSRDEEFCQEFMKHSSAEWRATRKMVRAALKALAVQQSGVPVPGRRCPKCGYPDGPDNRPSSSSSPRENNEDSTRCFHAKFEAVRKSLSPRDRVSLVGCSGCQNQITGIDIVKKTEALQDDPDTNTSRQEPAGEPRPLDSSREEPADNEDPSFLNCEVVEIAQEPMSPIAALEGDIADAHSESDSDCLFEESFFDPAGYPRPKEESIEWAATLLHQLEQEEMEKELRLLVPEGMGPGRTVSFMYENRRHEVAIPEGCEVGQEVPIRMYKMPFLQKTPELAWAKGQQDDRYTVLDSLKHCTRAPAEECNFASVDMQNRINLYKLLRGSAVAPLLPYTPEDEAWNFDAVVDDWCSDGESDVS